MGCGLQVDLRKLRRDEHASFSFPAVMAELTPDVIKDHRMKAALQRLGKTLADQMKERYPDLVGVELHGVSFTMRYAVEDPAHCAKRKLEYTPSGAKPGHCGGCKLGRLPKRKPRKR